MALGIVLIIWGALFLASIVIVLAGGLLPLKSRQKEQSAPGQSQEEMVKQFHWTFPVQPEPVQRFAPARYSLKLPVSRARYQRCRQQVSRNLSPYRFDSYVMPSAPEVCKLAHKLRQMGRRRDFMAYDLLCFTLAFVQQGINYAHDVSSTTGEIVEYPKYPIETLAEQTGDCEDQAILMASLLKNMGFDVALLILPTHVALGVAGFTGLNGVTLIDPTSGKPYYYTETTVYGWLPGQVPQEFMEDIKEGAFDILPIIDAARSG